MDDQACRDAVLNLAKLDMACHAGLLLDRYLSVRYKAEGHPDEREKLFEIALDAIKTSEPLYCRAYERWKQGLLDAPAHTTRFLKTAGRLVVGLSADSILETGVTLHRTYGVPIIPGSALKGLASHYCHQVWGEADTGFKSDQEYHRTLFGNTEDSGHIIFYDAWMTPNSIPHSNGLIFDVMTPHHQEYYRGDPVYSPTDFDDPNPITFLSMNGTFLFGVECDVPDEDGKKWAGFAMKILVDALEHWGIGGKTNSGYGRLVPDMKVEEEEKIKGLPTKERIYAHVEQMDLKQIKKAFGKNRKKTREDYGEDLGIFIQAIQEIHGEQIREKLEKVTDKNERKAMKRILRPSL
jgi:CRISPR-associated protein Cmr6